VLTLIRASRHVYGDGVNVVFPTNHCFAMHAILVPVSDRLLLLPYIHELFCTDGLEYKWIIVQIFTHYSEVGSHPTGE
jgi:hypothetical protein